jgi:hypothetical protein
VALILDCGASPADLPVVMETLTLADYYRFRGAFEEAPPVRRMIAAGLGVKPRPAPMRSGGFADLVAALAPAGTARTF